MKYKEEPLEIDELVKIIDATGKVNTKKKHQKKKKEKEKDKDKDKEDKSKKKKGMANVLSSSSSTENLCLAFKNNLDKTSSHRSLVFKIKSSVVGDQQWNQIVKYT